MTTTLTTLMVMNEGMTWMQIYISACVYVSWQANLTPTHTRHDDTVYFFHRSFWKFVGRSVVANWMSLILFPRKKPKILAVLSFHLYRVLQGWWGTSDDSRAILSHLSQSSEALRSLMRVRHVHLQIHVLSFNFFVCLPFNPPCTASCKVYAKATSPRWLHIRTLYFTSLANCQQIIMRPTWQLNTLNIFFTDQDGVSVNSMSVIKGA